MSDATAVTAITLFVFFLVGIAVGIIAVIAGGRRTDTAARYVHAERPPGGMWPYLRETDPEDDEPTNLHGTSGGWP